ncbi:MAG: error-prone DNA polymerase [Caulobacteraceae bacterium]
MAKPPYAELAVTTAFSFLRGASLPQELVDGARELGHSAIAMTDRNTLAGVVRAWSEARTDKFRLVIGARLAFADGTPDILVYPQDREAYGRLTRLLTRASTHDGVKSGGARLSLDDLLDHQEGLCLAVMPPARPDDALRPLLDRLASVAPDRLWLAAAMTYGPADSRRLDELAELAQRARARLLACNDVLYHSPERRPLQDVMTCIREHTTLGAAGTLLQPNAERCLKAPFEMARLFRDHPQAIAETQRIVERCTFDLSELRYEYPDEPVPPGKTAQQHLEDLAWAGAAWRYPQGVPGKVRAALAKEFEFIRRRKDKNYANYFLTVHDIVLHARGLGILCQGRGSAANSVVCYCLGVTSVDPMQIDLLFERFVSDNRDEPPDIDVDFEHERREEVIQYIYQRYGRHRAAICATVIHYRPRSAIREVGKALGLTEDVTAALARTVWGSWGDGLPEDHVRQAGLDPDNPTIKLAVQVANELIGFPRHLSQHVGGFILTKGRLDETVPIANAAMKDRTFIEWDKDDIDEVGLMKVDVLALGMLSCIRRAFDLMNATGTPIAEMADIKEGDKPTYDMLCEADSIGVFQVESRAQMNMLPRLRPQKFYDLVIEVAIVRPGPIQGDMVHPYLRRRAGKEPVVFESPHPDFGPPDELHRVLNKTMGVPLFQEQAMQIAINAAGFTPSEADGLRRAMATFKSSGRIDLYREKMVGGMVRRGYPPDFAERCFKQIEGFGSYGFPESHAASFALLVYISAWLKCHHPAVFAAALLNSQPMGFYAPAQIVRDAVEHGVETRPIDVEHSHWDCTLERREDDTLALRLGFRQIDGFPEAVADDLIAARAGGFGDFETLARRSGLSRAHLQKLAEADAFRSIGLDRRAGLWQVRAVAKGAAAPLADVAPGAEVQPQLPLMALSQHVVADYQTTRLSLKAHPMSFLRPAFAAERVRSCAEATALSDGASVATAGVVLVRQRPGTGKVCFITIEDETGVANLVVLPEVFQKYRREIMTARLLQAHGRIQKSPEGVVHVTAYRLVDRSGELARLDREEIELKDLTIRADMKRRDPRHAHHGHPRNVRIIPPSRDFH